MRRTFLPLLLLLSLSLLLPLLCHAAAAAATATTNSSPSSPNPIQHLVVIMMENRSFDHMVGFLNRQNPHIEGPTGQEYNLETVDDPQSRRIYINTLAKDPADNDPPHSYPHVTFQIYGVESTPKFDRPPLMNGFVQSAENADVSNLTTPMSMFVNATAPIINTLATQFALFDHYYASVPGPTDPNRGFFMGGTAHGILQNFNGTLWTDQSIFDFYTRHGVTWRAYYQDDPWAIAYYKDMTLPENKANVFTMEEFFEHVQNGELPQFVVLQPRMLPHKEPPNWQHPIDTVVDGERLLKQIYETLRASKFWNQLAFVINYDEHGGFFDHVPPPFDGVPSPDGKKSAEGFEFNRLGVRVPFLVISPWVDKGTVVHAPLNGPTPTSQYEHTSVMATAHKLFGVNAHMTARDAWAATFETLFTTRTTPRTDCPMRLPNVAGWTAESLQLSRARPIHEDARRRINFFCLHNYGVPYGHACGAELRTLGDAADFVATEAKKYMKKD